jgi:hypothetical protein
LLSLALCTLSIAFHSLLSLSLSVPLTLSELRAQSLFLEKVYFQVNPDPTQTQDFLIDRLIPNLRIDFCIKKNFKWV